MTPNYQSINTYNNQLSVVTERAQAAEVQADRDEARKEAQRMAVENSRLVGELEALKTQVTEQTAIIRGIAVGRERKAAKKTE